MNTRDPLAPRSDQASPRAASSSEAQLAEAADAAPAAGFVALPLPDPPGSSGGPFRLTGRQRLADAFDAVSAWLPMLLMALVALGTWWLVKNTPLSEAPRAATPPRHEPDYTMNTFLVQRFAKDGALRVEIRGERMRHYPDTDTYEIDAAHLRSIGADGRITTADARTALANRDASEVQLSGGAHVVREAGAGEEALDFRGEFLDVFQTTEQVRSHLPVLVTQGAQQIRADGMTYDHLTRRLELRGRTRAVLAAPASTSAPKR